MIIDGIGVISVWGRGLEVLLQAINNQSQPEVSRTSATPVLRIPDDTIKNGKALSRGMRRADRFSKLAALAAIDAVADSGVTWNDPERVGIVFASGFGPHNTTFRFLDDIIDFGDAETSPTVFSHSVHNAAVSYISKEVEARGPTVTLTQFETPFQQALTTASAWLATRQCDRVLVGAGDVSGDVLEFVAERKLPLARTEALKPFFKDRPACIPGEAMTFFLLSANGGGARYARIAPPTRDSKLKDIDLQLVDGESPPGFVPLPRTDTRCYSPSFGTMPCGTALHCAIAAALVHDQGAPTRVCCTRGAADADHHIVLTGLETP